MSQSEENMSDNQWSGQEWRNAFQDADDTPPSGLWDAIERRLDEEESKTVVIPFWTSYRPFLYGAAAAVALLLVGWWAFNSAKHPGMEQPVAIQQPAQSNQPEAFSSAVPNTSSTPEKINDPNADHMARPLDRIAATEPTRNARNLSRTRNEANRAQELAPDVLQKVTKALPATDNALAYQQAASEKAASARRVKAQQGLTSSTENVAVQARTDQDLNSSTTPPSSTDAEKKLVSEALADNKALASASYELLESKQFSLKTMRGVNRIIWYRAPDLVIEPESPKKSSKKDYWTAIAYMPMSFNPATSVRTNGLAPLYSASQTFSANRAVQSPELQNHAQWSTSLQLNTGMKLSKHWSVETGVNYLQGRSVAQSNAVVFTALSTSSPNNLLENALRNSASPAYSDKSNFAPSSLTNDPIFAAATSDEKASVQNNYRFLQIPLQAGFNINPDAKLSYSVLGGALANVFLQNTVGSYEITSDDNIYRPVILSGTAGLRVNYRPTNHWSGSLTGSFQRALQSGTRPEAQVQTRPQAMGVGFGLNYHF
ncbi:outer membrane protein [Tellurirhabdus bombi]|uniref:outer membrane protein n=1 Tax=Tellurirhabdus bombi TaxID=2907205 RepID=UPI001F1DEE96|nr:hypothetical protein [Tellurirhabdus bombi]